MWALQIVVRIERDEPPSATDVIEAVASGVVRLLADERVEPGGPWHHAVAEWEGESIRKVVRRARGAAWERVQLLDGVGTMHDRAEVRVLVPCLVEEMPADVRKLQVGGTDLPDPGRREAVRVAPLWPGVVVALDPRLAMSTGKAAAQAGHAAQLAWRAMGPERRATWGASGHEVVAVFPRRFPPPAWPVVVRDAGHTEVAPGTVTAAATWS